MQQRRLNQEFFARADAIEGVGIDRETAEKITAENDPAKKATLFAQAWQQDVTPEAKAELIARTSEAMDAARQAQEDPEQPTREIEHDPETGAPVHVVRKAEGREIYRTTDEDAADEAFAQEVQRGASERLMAEDARERTDEEGVGEAKEKAAASLLTDSDFESKTVFRFFVKECGMSRLVKLERDRGVRDEKGWRGDSSRRRESLGHWP